MKLWLRARIACKLAYNARQLAFWEEASSACGEVGRTTATRILDSDISGPHGLVFSPDRKNFFVTIGHGRPYGTALKYSSSDDRVEKQVELGLFPATADVTPDGNFLFVVNFNLHGDPVPSNVSVVADHP